MRTRRYAEDTKVPASRSREEIEEILHRQGATEYGFATSSGRVALVFTLQDRRVRFTLDLPDPKTRAQQHRQRWRALLLCIKSKLEAVAGGIETFDEAFMPHIVTPNGKTVGEQALPAIETAYATGHLPPLLEFQR